MSSASEFGKDFGLISEVVVTGRKAGWSHDIWKKLAHDENLMRMLLPVIQGRAEVTVKSRLTASTSVTLPALKSPKRLKDCSGVWLSANTTNLFASVDELPAAKKREVEYHDLVEPLNDFYLIEEIGGEDRAVFTSVAVLETTISQMVAKQADGKPGYLLNDGKANIFYVRNPKNHEQVLCVRVYWDADYRKWYVGCDQVNAIQWSAGNRAFQATAALT